MSQKVFVKLEKKLACDLKPGELFITEEPEQFSKEMNGRDPAVVVMMRTNLLADEVEDAGLTVHKVHIVLVNREDPAPPRVDPHAPPGSKEF